MLSRKTVLIASFLGSIVTCFYGNCSGDPLTSYPREAEYNLNSTSGRAYRNNLEFLLSELSSKGSNPNGFYNFTAVTAGADTAYGLFYCWAEATPYECQTCVKTASLEILGNCPNTTWAVIWGDKCLLRFSREYIFSRLDTSATWHVWNTASVSDILLLNQILGNAFDEIATDAAYNDVSGKKYAVRESDYMPIENQRIYSMGQCSPDLSNMDCESCLRQAISQLPECCYGRAGGNVLNPSCRARYEMYPFFVPPIPSPPPPGKDGWDVSMTLIIFVGIVGFVAIIILFFVSNMIRNREETEVIDKRTDACVSNISTETEDTRLSVTEELINKYNA